MRARLSAMPGRWIERLSPPGSSAVLVIRSPHKSLFNLSVDFIEPLLSAVAFFTVKVDLSFQFRDPVLSGPELMRKLLRYVQGVPAVFFSHAGGFVKQLQNGLSGFVELIDTFGCRVFRTWRKRNYGLGLVCTATRLYVHFTRPSCVITLTF
jgi:hypothetical protein